VQRRSRGGGHEVVHQLAFAAGGDRAPIEALLSERYRSAGALSPFDYLYERGEVSDA
jgi:hypothetical protein